MDRNSIAAKAPIPLNVDIISDVVCPWCIIGYRQFQRGLGSVSVEFDLRLRWHAFELNPRMPEGGQNLREHLALKYGASVEHSRATRTRLTALGESLGFRFNYGDDMRMVNTFRAHQLLHWALEQGQQTALKLALFEAFFTDRRDVNDIEVLVTVAADAGLSGTEAREVLADQRYAAAVRAEQEYWHEREVHAVPTFIINDSYPIPGAQDARTFARVLEKAAQRYQGNSSPL